ncbi:MAG TPA: zinc-binding dehydrogenase [Sphingopyxis sp.]|nr:zinc-binding dehydrogenase [Sphingopyxis sp.]
MTALPETNLRLLTLVTPEGQLELFFDRVAMPQPKPHEVLVKVLATPINPSDLGLLVGAADMSTARSETRNGLPAVVADVPAAAMRAMQGRIGDALPIGNEGCGLVVQAGSSPEAQALLGKTVAMLGGEIYAEYRCLPVQMCMVLPDDVDPKDGASCFVNPLTSLAFTEVMRMEGHSAIVHTAAASNLGQMLVKICAKDEIPLVNIVRSDAQAKLLKDLGSQYVLNSQNDDFMEQLVEALTETGATIGFDAIGGGKLSGQILAAMEAAAVKRMTSYSRYGSDSFKQMYIYGGLDMGPTQLTRSFGFSWSLSGFLLTPFLQRAGAEVTGRMRQRVADELTTTFKSHYSNEISLLDTLKLDVLQAYNAKRTGEKYLIRP